MKSRHLFFNQGFTLLEMVLVLFLLGLMASTTLMLSEGVEDQAKYDETKRRMEIIRKAIIGDPTRTINGSPEISGFVVDMGRLPNDLRELTEQAYCLTVGESYTDEASCTAAGYTWLELTVYSVFYQCSDPGYLNQTDCESNGETWDENQANMSVGWNGPYIQVQPEQDGSLKLRDAYGNSGDNSEAESSDARNAGWKFNNATPDLTLSSEGFDVSITTDNIVSAGINEADWKVNISSGLSVAFVKPYDPSPSTNSRCSDPSNTTKAACTSPETWFGGCNKAGYFNKDSCTTDSGTWQSCSDNTKPDKSSCEGASETWYGEGYGCSAQQYTTKTDCEANSETWRSCSDDGTITDKAVCESNNQIWHGENIFSIPLAKFLSKSICMKIFYRQDGAISEANSSAMSLEENGSHQTMLFNGFTNTDIPAGINKVGIYEHDGANCTDIFYPNNRTNVIDVVFPARTQLGVINW